MMPNHTWGNWRLDMHPSFSLNIHATPWWEYEVPLERLKADGLKHWQEHMSEKRWITKADIANLAKAYNELEKEGLL